VPSLESTHLSFPELPDQLDRFLEHLEPDARRRPAIPVNVLVQILTRPDSQEEPALEHRPDGRRSLSDDRRMHTDQRARDTGADAHSLCRDCDAAEHAPDEGTLPLVVDPRMEVIGDQREREPSFLCVSRILHEVQRLAFFAGECVPDLHVQAPFAIPRRVARV
jgi:hypothetical protein